MLAILGLVFGMLAPMAQVGPAYAATVNSAVFSGGAGTVGGPSNTSTLYAKQGGVLTLTVTTSNDTKCVEVTGDHTARQNGNLSTWIFSFTAGAGNGLKTVTATAFKNKGATVNDPCDTSNGFMSASYILDNTGPGVTAILSPAANGAGWNNRN